MHLIGLAGTYTPPEGGESNHWIVHMNSDALSLGTYSIPAGGTDDQEPHTEDEVYVVQAGRATLVTASGTVPVEPAVWYSSWPARLTRSPTSPRTWPWSSSSRPVTDHARPTEITPGRNGPWWQPLRCRSGPLRDQSPYPGGALAPFPRDQSPYGRLLAAPYRRSMDSGPAVSVTDATTRTAVTDAAAGKLAQTRARCQAALAAADQSVQRAQVALATAEEVLRRAQDAQMRFRELQASRTVAA